MKTSNQSQMKRSATVLLTLLGTAACDDTPPTIPSNEFQTGGVIELPWAQEQTNLVPVPKPSCYKPEDFTHWQDCVKPAPPTVIVQQQPQPSSDHFWLGYVVASNMTSSSSSTTVVHHYQPRSVYVRSYTQPTWARSSVPSVRPSYSPTSTGSSRPPMTMPATTSVSRGGFGSTGISSSFSSAGA